MNMEKILHRFAIMTDMNLDASDQWLGLMEESAREIRSQLREGINEKDYEDRLDAAVAVLAVYKYTLFLTSRSISFSTSEGISAVTAGITDRKNMLAAADSAWSNARAGLYDILKDPSFIFQGVK